MSETSITPEDRRATERTLRRLEAQLDRIATVAQSKFIRDCARARKQEVINVLNLIVEETKEVR